MSLDLDLRQRAMLQEMGLHVWLPPAVAVAPLAVLPALTPVVRSNVLPLPLAAPAPPVALPLPIAAAIENIAVHAISTGASTPKALKIQATDPAAALPAVLVDGIATLDAEALGQTIASCQACLLCHGRRAPVFAGFPTAPEGLHQADWLVVGEPPDEVEERAGMPFVDLAGQLLDNMLKAVGVRRLSADASGAAAAYITNVVKCRPGLARNPTVQELAICENYLRREVALVQPKVILALGRFAAQTLLRGNLPEGKKLPFGKLRGQIYRYQGIPVIVSYHPTYLLRTPQDKARAWDDLCLALQVVRGLA